MAGGSMPLKIFWKPRLMPALAVAPNPPGEWILANRPAAVVVETACTPDHGAQPGVAITCR